MRDRELHEEAEKSKKYSGPVGKNPWGAIAEDWTTSKKKRDFAEDLQLFALQTGVRTVAGQPVGLHTAKNMPGAADIKRQVPNPRHRLGPKDWDAPQEEGEEEPEEGDAVTTLVRREESPQSPSKRRATAAESFDVTDDESEDDVDDDTRWKSKLKRPRMAMVADQVESKASARARLFSGMKRTASSRIEIEVEEVEEGEMMPVGDRDLRLIIRGRNEGEGSEGRRLNERFNSGDDLRNRLGRRSSGGGGGGWRRGSGDSLERENLDEDLRAELNSKKRSMQIEVGGDGRRRGKVDDAEEGLQQEGDKADDEKEARETESESGSAMEEDEGGAEEEEEEEQTRTVLRVKDEREEEEKKVARRTRPLSSTVAVVVKQGCERFNHLGSNCLATAKF